MSLPIVDRESNQLSFSEWVMYAGQALRQAGYLESEPTGLYDEEFAAAVAAFQAFHAITEEDHVGPYTWAALGVEDSGTGQQSEAVAGHSIEAGQLSEDGQWQWDGNDWTPAAAHSDVDVEAFASATAVVSGHILTADPSEFEDNEVASSIFRNEHGILRQWKMALDSFNEVMESETEASAKPDFASALLKIFEEKVLGAIITESKAGLVFDVLKSVMGEAERAKNASKSVAFRDFYVTHQNHIANLDRELVQKEPVFVTAVRKEAERMVREDPNSYGMLRMELMDLYQDTARRLQSATQEALFADLSAEWVSGSVHGDLQLRVRESDLAIIDVKINAPDGDKLVEKLTKQSGGMDVWHMHAPKVLIYMDANGHNDGEVHLDASNRLTNKPMTQDGKYKKRYARLIAEGGLAPLTKH